MRIAHRFFALLVLAAMTISFRPAHAQAGSAAGAAADCCTPDALQKVAASVGFVDIVGVKLGMSPKEAIAALKASSPSLRIQLYDTALIMPSKPNDSVRVPHYIVAHTSPPAKDGSAEAIALEFTLPPSHPVVSRVYRWIQFPSNGRVAAGNLVASMRKKYGTETSINSIYHNWVYSANGQPITRPLSGAAQSCKDVGGTNDGSGFNVAPLTDGSVQNVYGQPITLLNTQNQPNDMTDTGPACVDYVSVVGTIVVTNPGDPSDLAFKVSVAMQSAALVRGSRIATHEWLQSDLDRAVKQQKDAGAARKAPVF